MSIESLSKTQLSELLANQSIEQLGKLVVALVQIVGALKSQPNFDYVSFNNKLMAAAESKTDPKDTLTKTVLLLAAGAELIC
jgi:2-phospho-L-lactate guanylyltransferase (CobY/MobA/RfbA family)